MERASDVRAGGLLRPPEGRGGVASKPWLRLRAALAPLLLAAYTLVAAAGAALALAPALLAGGPLGRRRTPRGVAPAVVAARAGEEREARGVPASVATAAAEEREALGS